MGQSNVHVNSGLGDASDEVEGSECVGDLLVAPTVADSSARDGLTSALAWVAVVASALTW